MSHQRKDRIYWQQQDLRKVVRNWNLIPGSPENEFDALAQKILSHLYSDKSSDKLSQMLESELVLTYGLFPVNPEDIEEMTTDIKSWWQQQN